MKKIIRVLMERDGYTREEAIDYYKEVMSEVYEAASSGDYELAEDIFQGEFGLEIDYLLEVLI